MGKYSKPYVILPLVEGFRHVCAKKYNAENLIRLLPNEVIKNGDSVL